MDCSRARTNDPGEWLQTCPDFSQPLAELVVEWFLNWEPDLAESIKWNMLCFSGRKLVCGLSACKAHLGITFFRGTELPDPAKLVNPGGAGNTNIRLLRLTTLDGSARDALRDLLHAAVELDADPTLPPAPRAKRHPSHFSTAAYIFRVVNTPRALEEAKSLVHVGLHESEGKTVAPTHVSEQWAGIASSVTGF
jgi:hypothetical protein